MSTPSNPDVPPPGPGLGDIPALARAMREAAVRTRLMADPQLTYLFWECTLRCNLRCAHCGSSCGDRPPPGELGTREVLAALDTIIEDFDASRIALAITGGEPLIRPDLEEVAACASRAGMTVGMVTNGVLATAERARDLVQSGMTIVSVSIDGLEASHDAVRGPGTFQKTLAGIEALRRGGFRAVEILTCVRPANLGELDDIEAMVGELGIRSWRLLAIDRMGRAAGPTVADAWLDPGGVVRLLEFIRSRRRLAGGAQDAVDVRFSCGGYLGPRYELAVRPCDGQCLAGLCAASILHDGSVGACPSLPRELVQGSVLKDRFSRIWKERFELFRKTEWRRSGPCESCSWFQVCLGGGLHGRYAQPDSFCWLKRQSTE